MFSKKSIRKNSFVTVWYFVTGGRMMRFNGTVLYKSKHGNIILREKTTKTLFSWNRSSPLVVYFRVRYKLVFGKDGIRTHGYY